MGFGPNTEAVLAKLRRFESRNILFEERDGSWPIVWERAKGVHVWDAEGRKYLDLTAAFGVAAAGHANAAVIRAGQKQLTKLPHAMGDVHPHRLKGELAECLSGLTFSRWRGRRRGKTIFCNSGFEAVEAALKTARLATDRPGVVAFKRAYHGLGYGALNATHRAHFRERFRDQLRGFVRFVDFPNTEDELEVTRRQIERAMDRHKIGTVLAEPIQARGGINVPPVGFLKMLREICDRRGALLILDEIYTGFGRTGEWFACDHEKAVPDLICLGKALTGGFPMSVCVGRADVMDAAWPASDGEAIHTSTYLGNPVGCAMALVQLGEIERLGLVEHARDVGDGFRDWLGTSLPESTRLRFGVRGAGLMIGVETNEGGRPATAVSLEAVKRMLADGFILLPEGESAETIGFTPPLTITQRQLMDAGRRLIEILNELAPR